MIRSIRLHRIQSEPVTLHFSPGYGVRAQKLGKLVLEGHLFLSEWLGVEARTTLSVLRRESWRPMRRAPYGYPHSVPDKATIFAPAHYPPRIINAQRAIYEAAAPSLQQRVHDEATPIDTQIKKFYDLVAIHELGHLFIHHLRLALGTHWLTELIANLFATAFFVESRPDLATDWLAWADLQASLDVPYRSIEQYDAHYNTLDFANANYYQGRLNQHALQLWQQHGRDIAPTLINHFSLRPQAVATRFAHIAPDFTLA
ncbi:MAG: hypothetical protein ACPGWR_22350 [Ardenticatenaceae bacterium]